jgi:putative SOS response-associated peptidase YedK
MCGRFTLAIEPEELQAEFQIPDLPAEWRQRYNIAPTQPVAVILDPVKRNIEFLHWGLVPGWAKDVSIGTRLINARAESLTEKPSFRTAFAKRRCLILTDGYFEWKKNPKGPSTPYWFTLKSEKPFAFAGLWETWRNPEGSELKSCTIITCAPNEIAIPVHDRMPVMLPREKYWLWLNETNPEVLKSFLVPFPSELMKATQVGRVVNSAQMDSPECILPEAI